MHYQTNFSTAVAAENMYDIPWTVAFSAYSFGTLMKERFFLATLCIVTSVWVLQKLCFVFVLLLVMPMPISTAQSNIFTYSKLVFGCLFTHFADDKKWVTNLFPDQYVCLYLSMGMSEMSDLFKHSMSLSVFKMITFPLIIPLVILANRNHIRSTSQCPTLKSVTRQAINLMNEFKMIVGCGFSRRVLS